MDPNSVPSAPDLYTKIGLYDAYDISKLEFEEKMKILNFSGPVDVYCIWCLKDSVFSTNNSLSSEQIGRFSLNPHFYPHKTNYSHELTCSRSVNHLYTYYFRVVENVLMKIGQHPPAVDIESSTIKKYLGVLDKDLNFELRRAIGLYTHGCGIAAFIHLRRIFENLVEEAKKTKTTPFSSVDEGKYLKGRMSEKIELLQKDLPEFLVQNKNIYNILSLGVHQLDETDCMKHYPILRSSIEIILDQKLAENERISKENEVQQSLANIQSKANDTS